jgi:hypothetical protein
MKRLAFLVALLSLLAPTPAFAQVTLPSYCTSGTQINLGVPIGGVTSISRENAFRCYVLLFYRYVIGVAIVLATIVVTWGGYIWLTSGGDPSKITHARELIIGALSGLALLLLASVVLRLIGIGGSS